MLGFGESFCEMVEGGLGMAMEYRHDEVLVPEERVFVEGGSGVEGEVVVLLPVADAVQVHVCLESDWVTACVAEEFEVYFVVLVGFFRLRLWGRELHFTINLTMLSHSSLTDLCLWLLVVQGTNRSTLSLDCSSLSYT